MKIILHIGQSKTGTSAIQDFLTRHRKQLAERGILYPSPRVHGLPIDFGNHNPLADSLAGVVRYPYLTADEYFSQFFASARRINAKMMIISAEHFFGGQPRPWNVSSEAEYFLRYRQKVESLCRHLKGHEVSIVVYLRPQVDWISSNISQTIAVGGVVHQSNIFVDDRSYYEKYKFLLKYCDKLDIWSDVCQPRQFAVVPYVRNKLFENSSVSDFLFRCGLSDMFRDMRVSEVSANESLSREYLEIKKDLNSIPRSHSEARAIVHCLKKLSRRSNLGTTYRLDPEVVVDLESYVAEDNLRLSRTYLNGQELFVAKAAYRGGELKPLGDATLARARSAFDREYRRPSTRLLAFRHTILEFLRKRVPPAHAALHQVKRFRRRLMGKRVSARSS
ncbi:hypothetical protein [Filomicrobium sp.]|uniref:hypothetical protein n=1 Tax=Filomicrobium sp. TaxID=2024831 RepID=UPI00258C5EC6|nr:hypothetical protein [Filomicrobium sp.]MCV0371471.1 hypothetical protein [Filomicrobium sp.]